MENKISLYDERNEHDACGIGAVVDINGRKSHRVLSDALEILRNLEHRGGVSADGRTGDGAGVLLQIPKKLYASLDLGFALPKDYAVGHLFLSRDESLREREIRFLRSSIEDGGMTYLGERAIPVRSDLLSDEVRRKMPYLLEIFVSSEKKGLDFERQLYLARRKMEKAASLEFSPDFFYFLSLSSRTVCYKGMLLSSELGEFFPDLLSPLAETAIALVHSRFSTNTLPNWERAHPNRMMIHNGEINTIKSNVSSLHNRESNFSSPVFGENLRDILPVIPAWSSDSAMFDNALEFFYMNGKEIDETLLMMIPECWSKDSEMSVPVRGLMEYNANLMEPWDGPASIVATDGVKVTAILDRNGLRPSKYVVTKDGRFVLSSEFGALCLKDSQIAFRGTLMPGKLITVDTRAKKVFTDEEIKEHYASLHPYSKWTSSLKRIDHIEFKGFTHAPMDEDLAAKQVFFGYTREEIRNFFLPMSEKGEEPVGSMGIDTKLPCLNANHPLLTDYFHQLFAQVTNPPIDSIREDLVFSSRVYLGKEGNLLEISKENIRAFKIPSPVLTCYDIYKLRNIRSAELKQADISVLFDLDHESLESAVQRISSTAVKAVRDGSTLLLLNDRGMNDHLVPVPVLLIVSAVHSRLSEEKLRTLASLIVETAEARDTHQMAALIAYGAQGIYPYLAYDTIKDMNDRSGSRNYREAILSYQKGLEKGIIKILSKMGVSTIASYIGSGLFETVGLDRDFVERYFPGTRATVPVRTMQDIEDDLRYRRDRMVREKGTSIYDLPPEKEEKLFTPEILRHLQSAVRNGSYEEYKAYSSLLNERKFHLRDLMDYDASRSIDISEVEPEEKIIARFKASAMSFGAISKSAHECIAVAFNRLGAVSNSGEGGEDPERYRDPEKTSFIKQVASGRFGVNIEYLNNAREIQIKVAQGAKPGEGGHLPGIKVTPDVARARESTPGVALISPPPHHDIYSIEDLEQLIHDLKCASPEARISVKLCSEAGVGTIVAGVVKAGADSVTICGYDGGTGASPLSSIRHTGIPLEIGLAETQETLILNGLRKRTVLAADSKLLTGHDVVKCCLLGAEQFGFATVLLLSLGCVMDHLCHKGTCMMGIATQDPKCESRFRGKPEHLTNLMHYIAREMREDMALLGFRTIEEMVGRSDCLLPEIPALGELVGRDMSAHFEKTADRPFLEKGTDHDVIIPYIKASMEKGKAFRIPAVPVVNSDRSIGASASSYIYRTYGKGGLDKDRISIRLKGNAGNSFGAFLIQGLTLKMNGMVNDYAGKGLSGGIIAVSHPDRNSYAPHADIIAGNVCLYGATGGEAYFDGKAGERFAVRNSGARAVCLGTGTHALEYMTGGVVLILGEIGRNAAAGMSGGYAFVKGEKNKSRINMKMVGIYPLDKADIREVKAMMRDHIRYTNSWYVKYLYEYFDPSDYFKIVPNDYRLMTERIREYTRNGYEISEASRLAYESFVKKS